MAADRLYYRCRPAFIYLQWAWPNAADGSMVHSIAGMWSMSGDLKEYHRAIKSHLQNVKIGIEKHMQIAHSCVTWLVPTWYASFTCEMTDKHRKGAQCVSVHSMCVTCQWIAHACATDSCMRALSSIFSTLQRTCSHCHACSKKFLTLRVLQD